MTAKQVVQSEDYHLECESEEAEVFTPEPFKADESTPLLNPSRDI